MFLTHCRVLSRVGFRHSTVTFGITDGAGIRLVDESHLASCTGMRAAIYARVSTLDQHVENQLQELRTYCERRGWTATEFIDQGVSGAKERRPALDEMLKAAKRRRFDVLIVWRLDRLGRNLRHLILLLDELHALGVAFVSLAEGIDATTPAGRLQLHVLGAIANLNGRESMSE